MTLGKRGGGAEEDFALQPPSAPAAAAPPPAPSPQAAVADQPTRPAAAPPVPAAAGARPLTAGPPQQPQAPWAPPAQQSAQPQLDQPYAPPQAAPPGYGYPAPPGYGYPAQQQPGHAHQYGHPHQYGYPAPPPAYGQQPPAYGQQPPGHPGGPPGYAPFPGPAPVPGRSRAGLIGGIVAGVVVLALIGLGVVLLADGKDQGRQATAPGVVATGTATPGGGSGPTAPGTERPALGGTLAAAWQLPAPAKVDIDDRLMGSWLLPGAIVRGSATGVRAYDLSTGRPLWTLTPPAGATDVCAMAPAPNKDGVAAVAFDRGKHNCALVSALDAATGRIRWTHTVKPLHGDQVGSTDVFVSDSTVVIGNPNASGGLRITDGSTAWTFHDRDDICLSQLRGGGDTVVVDDFCGGKAERSQLRALDAGTGRTRWKWTLPGRYPNVSRLLSAEPVVVDLVQEPDNEYLLSFDSGGRPQAKIPLPDGAYGKLRFTELGDPVPESFVRGGTLFARSEEQRERPAVIAYDLASGRELWHWSGSGKDGAGAVGLTADGRVQAVSYGTYDEPSRLVTLDPATGAATPLATLPKDAVSFTLRYSRVWLGPAQVVVAPQTTVGSPLSGYAADGG
ncbi:PQQ-binding-like beta-propeller repeat protein [Streptomyces sp. NPDC092296]|uniref:outer membrane protein assembly factor BamB family protein n=1 Tax=Streptomyces sp. NPDC092296 TaxID=3366012 RepID=UPI003812A3C3